MLLRMSFAFGYLSLSLRKDWPARQPSCDHPMWDSSYKRGRISTACGDPTSPALSQPLGREACTQGRPFLPFHCWQEFLSLPVQGPSPVPQSSQSNVGEVIFWTPDHSHFWYRNSTAINDPQDMGPHLKAQRKCASYGERKIPLNFFYCNSFQYFIILYNS